MYQVLSFKSRPHLCKGSMFLLSARFNAQSMSYKALILALQLDIFDEKGVIRVKEEKFRLPVEVRGSKTSGSNQSWICFTDSNRY